MDAGWAVLARGGQAAFSFDAVVAEAGVTRGSLSSQFGSWRGYVDELIRWWATTRYRDLFATAVAAKGKPEERLASCLRFGMGLDVAGRALRQWALQDSELAELVEVGDRESVDVFTGLLVDAGVAPDDAEFRAWVMYTAFMGLYALRPPEKITRDDERLIDWLLKP